MSDDQASPQDVLAKVFELVDGGEFDAAETLCRKQLKKLPDDVNLSGMLGALLLKRGSLDEAEYELQRTVKLEPAFAKPHEDLGLLYLNRQDYERAVRSFRRSIELDAELSSARRGLATALQLAGQEDAAREASLEYLRTAPISESLARAEHLRRDGDLEQAEKLCEEVLRREAENLAALRLLAIIAADQERYVVAEGLLRRVISLRPQSSVAVRELGLFLADRSRFPEAIEVLERQEAESQSDPAVLTMLGDMYAIVGRSTDALESYEQALRIDPDVSSALLGRAHMLRIDGRVDEAADAYQRCIATSPEIGDAWWNLASLGHYEMTDEDIEAAARFASQENIGQESAIAFRFALARAYEGRGEFNDAWAQYEKGNALKRATVSYDPVEIDRLHKRMINLFDGSLEPVGTSSVAQGPAPIFIVGMPRSGSTLIEQILASHSSVEGAGELPYIIMIAAAIGGADDEYPDKLAGLDSEQLTGLGLSYLHHAGTHCSAGTPFFTDKMPANFSHCGFIKRILPNAKIIDARRNPLATCVANFRHLFAKGKNQTYDTTELAEHYLQYVSIMDHWDKVSPGMVLRVQYEDVVSDLEAQIRRLLAFCELDFEPACLEFHANKRPVNTASSEQVRKPIYESGVNFHENYAAHLDEFREILQPVL